MKFVFRCETRWSISFAIDCGTWSDLRKTLGFEQYKRIVHLVFPETR